jgi:hypothetical protein
VHRAITAFGLALTMISRQASVAIANTYIQRFSSSSRNSYGSSIEKVHYNSLYDFLFENEYEAWFCNLSQKLYKIRQLKEFFLKLHTGESLTSATKDWTWENRQKLGQRLLRNLAEDQLQWYETIRENQWLWNHLYASTADELVRRLELDGYIFQDGVLLFQQSDVLDVEQERSILETLFQAAKLKRSSEAFQFLTLAEEHFIAGRWSDIISNARKFFELTATEGARAIGTLKGSSLDESSLARPAAVRQFLERQGLLEKKERETFDKVYSLLSETGAHPYMAESDQARLLRQLSLTLSQFILLRLCAALSTSRREV